MSEMYGYWPPQNWEEGLDAGSLVGKLGPAVVAAGAAAALVLGATLGRMTSK
jgi:hypothetical protein